MRLSSVRMRLTFWNTVVMAAALATFAVAIHIMVGANLRASVDGELAESAEHVVDGWRTYQAVSAGKRATGRARIVLRGARPQSGAESRYEQLRSPRLLDPRGRSLVPFWPSQPYDGRAFAAAVAGRRVYSQVTISQVPVRVYSVPLTMGGKRYGAVQVARPLDDLERLNRGLTRTLLTLIPLAVLAAFAGGAFLTDRALRPVKHISQAADRLGANDLSRRLPVTGGDEFAELAESFNRMLQRLEEAFQRQRRFTADASHELRTPLTTIKANTSLALSESGSAEEYREALEEADRAADTMSRIVQDLLLLAKSDDGQIELELAPVSAAELLRLAAEATSDQEHAHIDVQAPEPDLDLLGDMHHLLRLMGNLVENAMRHTPTTGRIVLSARAEGDMAAITVADNGEGISPEHLPHLFERFYRVDLARSREHGGFGLGLAICKSIAEAHGGSLSIRSAVGVGTEVTVWLPRALPPGSGGAQKPAIRQGGEAS